MTTEALAAQVGGDHYKGAIQPFQLSMANGHDGCTHAIQKYLTRFPKKAGIVDLQKAHHICMIRHDTMMDYGVFHPPEKPLIQMGDYLRSNKCSGHAAAALLAMENWFRTTNTDHLRAATNVRRLIRECAEHHYPETYNEEDFV